MSPRPNVSEERKVQILDAAMLVFTRMGFETARMDDIARESGLSKGALYWYFKSKDSIIMTLSERFFQQEIDNFKLIYQSSRNSSEFFHQMIDQTLNDIHDLQPWLPLMYDYFARSLRDDRYRSVIQNTYNQILDTLNTVLEQGIERGEIINAEPEHLSIAFGGLIEGTILLWIINPERVDIDTHFRSAVELFLKGIMLPNQII